VKAANLALVVALATGISANWSTIVSMFGSWVIVTAIIIVIVAGVLGLLPGLLLGGKSAEIRTTTGMVSVFRFASLGLIIIGAQRHGNPVYLGPAITFALVDFIVPLALAVEIGHRAGTPEPAPVRAVVPDGLIPGDGTRTTLGAWDLGSLMEQLDAIYRPDGGVPSGNAG